jgi:hypothetical protein
MTGSHKAALGAAFRVRPEPLKLPRGITNAGMCFGGRLPNPLISIQLSCGPCAGAVRATQDT